jgi:hypothetical protein
MSSFSWIRYDPVQKELSVSNQPFTPEDKSQWITFPFEITEKQIRVPVAIEGIHTRLFLDTGGGGQLSLDRETISGLFEKRPDLQKIRKKKTASLLVHGKVNELTFAAKKIRFGDTILKKHLSRIVRSLCSNHLLLRAIGIDLFKNTVGY